MFWHRFLWTGTVAHRCCYYKYFKCFGAVFVEGVILYKHAFSAKILRAVLLGLLGIVFLIFGFDFSGNSWANNSVWGMLFVLLAVLSGASNITLIGFAIPKLSELEIASLAFLFFAPFAFVSLFFTDFEQVFASPNFTLSSLMVLLYLRRFPPTWFCLLGCFGAYFLLEIALSGNILGLLSVFIGVYWTNKPAKEVSQSLLIYPDKAKNYRCNFYCLFEWKGTFVSIKVQKYCMIQRVYVYLPRF